MAAEALVGGRVVLKRNAREYLENTMGWSSRLRVSSITRIAQW